jgi:hypothetical protein
VRTGRFRAADLDGTAGTPDYIVDDIGQQPDLLQSLSSLS